MLTFASVSFGKNFATKEDMIMFAALCFSLLLNLSIAGQNQDPSIENERARVKTVSWTDLWKDIRFAQTAIGEWEFFHGDRIMADYVEVKVPASTLSFRHMLRVASGDEADLYLVVLNPSLNVKIRDGSGAQSSHPATVRLCFPCTLINNEEGCKQTVVSLLKKDVAMQALGVGNFQYERSPQVPKDLIFAFLLKMEGKI